MEYSETEFLDSAVSAGPVVPVQDYKDVHVALMG